MNINIELAKESMMKNVNQMTLDELSNEILFWIEHYDGINNIPDKVMYRIIKMQMRYEYLMNEEKYKKEREHFEQTKQNVIQRMLWIRNQLIATGETGGKKEKKKMKITK